MRSVEQAVLNPFVLALNKAAVINMAIYRSREAPLRLGSKHTHWIAAVLTETHNCSAYSYPYLECIHPANIDNYLKTCRHTRAGHAHKCFR
jgi:hypothetical protein